MSVLKPYLNLGCGRRFHPEWTNIDFVSNSEYVITYNLLNGIPFPDESFEVVYHSHILEHFTKTDGKKFLEECFRVLKPDGIIRIAVPDLEQIATEYLKNLRQAAAGDTEAACRYDWIMLEMYDQTVRNTSGGEMAAYLYQEEIPCEQYIYERIGEEARQIRANYLRRKQELPMVIMPETAENASITSINLLKTLLRPLKHWLKRLLFAYEMEYYAQQQAAFKAQEQFLKIGRFRMGGEIHQWMYDRYSLSRLLEQCGFTDIRVRTAFDSSIPEWQTFGLESKNGVIYKPDSLFMEARK